MTQSNGLSISNRPLDQPREGVTVLEVSNRELGQHPFGGGRLSISERFQPPAGWGQEEARSE